MGFQIHRRMLFAGQKAYHHQGDAADDGAGHGGAETEGHTCQLPAHADHEACHHAGDDAGGGGLLPEQRRKYNGPPVKATHEKIIANQIIPYQPILSPEPPCYRSAQRNCPSVGQVPADNHAAVPVNNGSQVHMAVLHFDVCDVD